MKSRKLEQTWKYPKIVFLVFLGFILLLLLQFAYLSLFPVVYGYNMDNFALSRNIVSKKLYAMRGTIYDRDKNVLALNVSSYTVIAYLKDYRTTNPSRPQHVVDPSHTAKALSPILNMTEEQLLVLLTNSKAYQVELGPGGRGITELKKDEIESLGLPGIAFIENYKRYYPNGDFASYTLGYAKTYEELKETDTGKETVYDIVGEMGIESKYNDLLKGTDGFLRYQRDRHGYKIPDTKEERQDAVHGNDVYLTIDANIQRFIEGALKKSASDYEPEWMQLTVMNAKTGEILGTSSTPSFDPNIRNITNYENPLVSMLYEPGSTMKTYAYLCALEKGTYKGSETFSSGSVKIGEHTIKDWNNTGWGTITFDKGYEYSSNVGIAYMVANWLNKEELRACYQKYGFGAQTGIELSREMVGKLDFNYDVEVATAGFGQGITTTAIQQLQALTLLANEGKLVKPHLVEKVIDSMTGATLYEVSTNQTDHVVSKESVDYMKKLMHNVVNGNDVGTTGRSYFIEGFDIIGKTGTSQIFDTKTRTYLTGQNDYIYSFSGMYPEDNPEIIVYAAMKKPKHSGSRGLSEATKSVMKSIATYYNMFSEKEEELSLSKYGVESYRNQNTMAVSSSLEEHNMKVIVIGNGEKIINQYPNAGQTLIAGDTILLLTNGMEITMPSMSGWSMAQVSWFHNLTGLSYEIEGYGYVKSQSIAPGTILTTDMKLLLTLEKKYETSRNP